MLDAATKRRIDTARDILVGKVPDPKSQVEQITIALIYKFMDDMDAQSEEFGGERTFFAGDFQRFGWAKLMRSGLGGQEVLNTYSEAISRMPDNPGIPPLFRSIFNNAYLPYRDPETLRAFLKVIDEFDYDHSEKLGDAFEYLLSVLGSQGDAGQFRTPRHIIDFIVEIVNPKKDERVLDPACGTAGFLISAYKHILGANRGPDGENLLAPEEMEALERHFVGYDISPDMVRLSQVNLYLHGFANPQVFEYDTLTSDDRWNDYFDVILANPPFMTPKGGIRPHSRFSIPATRSEVLFVDYIAEHLTTNGRAGIIVPEGVIFQSQAAYRKLRKKLVEESLMAVISLPAGVFNPYSPVKTTILILDSFLAKRTDQVCFFRVEHDGFDLGAQRRSTERNDLPSIADELRTWVRATESQAENAEEVLGLGFAVARSRIAAMGFSLAGERFRNVDARVTNYPTVKISEICKINPEVGHPSSMWPDGTFNYFDISTIENQTGRILGPIQTRVAEAPSRARRLITDGDIVLSTVRPNLKAFALLEGLPPRSIASTGFAVLRCNAEVVLPGFLIQVLRSDYAVEQMISMMEKGAYPSINQDDVASLSVPLPPLDVQQGIVAEIEGYQIAINMAHHEIDENRAKIKSTLSSVWH